MAKPLVKRTHPKGACWNRDCYKPYCQGYQLGFMEGEAAGYAAGYAAGEATCA